MSSSKNNYNLTRFDFIPIKIEDEKIGDDLWEIQQDVTCQLKINNSSFIYTLRKGFKTNYRSGPRWINAIAPKFGNLKIQVSWMIHDANYEGYLTQQKADNLLFHMLIAGELPAFNAEVIYLGLQIFGGFKYKNTADNEYVEFTQKISPPIEPVTRETGPIKLESSLENPIIFERENMKGCHEKLKEIAKENSFSYSKKDVEFYYD